MPDLIHAHLIHVHMTDSCPDWFVSNPIHAIKSFFRPGPIRARADSCPACFVPAQICANIFFKTLLGSLANACCGFEVWIDDELNTVESRYSKDFGQQTKLYYIGILYYFYTYEFWNFPKLPFVWVFFEKEVAWHKKFHTEPSGLAIFWEVFRGFQSFNLWFAQS